jgi:chromosome partitioning protein
MPVLALVGKKAGTGKTAAAVLLASEWHRRKKRVLLLDADPQQCALYWGELAEALGPDHPAVASFEPGAHVYEAHDIVIIDSAARHDALLEAVIASADIVLVPCAARSSDIEALHETAVLIRALGKIARAHVLISRRKLTGAIPDDLLESMCAAGLPVLATHLHQHVIFEHAIYSGSNAADFAPGTPAESEIMQLADEIEKLFAP